MVGGAERRRRQGQECQRQPRPSLELGDEPPEHSSQRQEQTGGKRHGRIAVQHDAGGVGEGRRNERRAPDAVVVSAGGRGGEVAMPAIVGAGRSQSKEETPTSRERRERISEALAGARGW